MNYFLNLELPLWWFFLPLIVALIPSAKWGKWKAKYYKAQFTAETNALQLIRDFERHKAASEAYQNELHKLKYDATEREALIVQLRKDLATENEILSERLADKSSEIEHLNKQIDYLATTADLNKMAAQHRLEWAESLQSKLQLSELAHNETKEDLEGLEQQFAEALSVINRTKRATKQWDKIIKEKAVNVVNTVIEAVKKKQAETVTHDSIGVPRMVKADQSENLNARHIKELGSEVVRGIAEQNAAIEKELEGVDMGTLEVGDSVKFHNGVTLEITEVHKGVKLYFVGFPEGDAFYKANGTWSTEGEYRPLDIVQIIKQPKITKSNKRKDCNSGCDSLCRELCDGL